MRSSCCDACGASVEDYDEAKSESSGLPESWFVRRIADRDYSLCDCCGSPTQFRGGISPYLSQALGLDMFARCELGEVVNIQQVRTKRGERRARRKRALR